MRFDDITKAIVEIAYDNGAIGQNFTEAFVIDHVFHKVNGSYSLTQLNKFESELGRLSDDDFMKLIAGDAEEYPNVSQELENFLNFIFENLP